MISFYLFIFYRVEDALRISLVIMSFSRTNVISSVNDEVGGVDVVPLEDGLEQFWVVDYTLLHEVDNDILGSSTHFLKVVALNGELVLKLSLSLQEIGVISVVEILLIGSTGSKLVGLNPGGESVSCESAGFDFGDLSSSEKTESSDFILERSEVPDSWDPEEI